MAMNWLRYVYGSVCAFNGKRATPNVVSYLCFWWRADTRCCVLVVLEPAITLLLFQIA